MRRLTAVLLLAGISAGIAHADEAWPAWDAFTSRFIEPTGRVVDVTFDSKTTSEGQSYALFFALVADRRDQFDTILAWTSNNLAKGQLGARRPSWSWGRSANGNWQVRDEHSAADADLWTAYVLLEAARLWQEPRYADIGRSLLTSIRRDEVVPIGDDTAILLPGPVGFELDRRRFRIAPSYFPGFLFRYLVDVDPHGPWRSVWDTYVRMAPLLFANGLAPDLATVTTFDGAVANVVPNRVGSYDAIRVYLWAGMSGADDELVRRLAPFADLIRRYGAPPERVDPQTGAVTSDAAFPIGFSGALLPYLRALGDEKAVATQRNRLAVAAATQSALGRPTNYYDQALILFGTGWLDGRFRFDAAGRVVPIWRR